MSGSQRQQEGDLAGKVTKRARGKRLKGRTPQKRENERKIPRRDTRRGKRALQPEGAEEVAKNKVRGQLRKHETKDDTEHRTVRSNGGVRQRKRTTQVGEKRSQLRHRGTRHRVTVPSTPSSIYRPLGLVVHSGGGAAAAGKLSSHCQGEAEGAGAALDIRNAVRRSTGSFWWKRWK